MVDDSFKGGLGDWLLNVQPGDPTLSPANETSEEPLSDLPPPANDSVVVPMPTPEPPAPRKPILVEKDSGLSVKNLGKQYAKRPVVRNVSLSLQRGEAVGLLGPNGAGKTTCFYMITGLVRPDYGTIYMDGVDITALPMYRRARLGIGYLPQEASIFRGLTVEQNIMAVLEVSVNDIERRHAMCDELLAEFSITHLRNAPALSLSGGERRRAEIARALAGLPSFILLDEPLAGIDPIAISDVRDLVKHLKDRGIGVLITDHNVRETLDVIERAYIIHDGAVLMEGTPSDIVNNEEVRRVYLGERFSL
jgi:lipopolysaccharide export system ATP-binding protein